MTPTPGVAEVAAATSGSSSPKRPKRSDLHKQQKFLIYTREGGRPGVAAATSATPGDGWQKRPGGVRVYRPSPCQICGSARRPNGTCGTCSRWAEANYISWLNQPALTTTQEDDQ